jgi:hypothetical protein
MKDWSAVATGFDIRIPGADLDRIRVVLDTLEADFRPLASDIPLEIEPAIAFRIGPETP